MCCFIYLNSSNQIDRVLSSPIRVTFETFPTMVGVAKNQYQSANLYSRCDVDALAIPVSTSLRDWVSISFMGTACRHVSKESVLSLTFFSFFLTSHQPHLSSSAHLSKDQENPLFFTPLVSDPTYGKRSRKHVCLQAESSFSLSPVVVGRMDLVLVVVVVGGTTFFSTRRQRHHEESNNRQHSSDRKDYQRRG